ncbi:MAG TPA: hypothetical protein VG650_11125 [Mycobacteriales bacterium]|nr:hypothetical protein [Mycobacteriales bacterium]
MEHVVFYQSTQGTPAFRRLASLEDAVSFAEHLRNVEGVTDFSVYSLSPVTLSLRAYYHVEVSTGDGASAAQSTTPAADAPPSPLDAAEPAPAAPAADTPDTPPLGSPLAPDSPTPAMSFNALEEEATGPLVQVPAPTAGMPFAAAPLPPASDVAPLPETFVKDDPADAPPPITSDHTSHVAGDPSIVDPTTEEVVPTPPTGRRSMGFFARS